MLAHGIIAMAAVALIHTAYRQYVAMVFDVPPSYLAHAGFMRLGLVTPLVTPDQLERAGVPRDLVADLKYPLTDRRSRMAHMWAPGGLVHELRRRNLDVERIARTVSGFALREHPWGLVPLGVATVGDYFTARGIAHALDNDLGRRVVPDDLVEALRRNWRFDAAGLHERASPVSRYFELGTWWLVACLFALAPLALVNLALHWRTPQRPVVALVALASLGLVLAHVLFVAVAFYRYLHPLPFFVLANLVPVLAARRTKSGLPHC